MKAAFNTRMDTAIKAKTSVITKVEEGKQRMSEILSDLQVYYSNLHQVKQIELAVRR
jgi:hypothetical protein